MPKLDTKEFVDYSKDKALEIFHYMSAQNDNDLAVTTANCICSAAVISSAFLFSYFKQIDILGPGKEKERKEVFEDFMNHVVSDMQCQPEFNK